MGYRIQIGVRVKNSEDRPQKCIIIEAIVYINLKKYVMFQMYRISCTTNNNINIVTA